MAIKVKQTSVLLKEYVLLGPVKPSHFEVAHAELDSSNIPEGGALLELVYLSVDPYLRGRMRPGKSYVKPFTPGQPLESGPYGAVGRVLESKSLALVAGQYLVGNLKWESHTILDAEQLGSLDKVDEDAGVPLSYWVGALGMPGMTGYSFVKKYAEPKAGEKAFISGASGAVGQVVGQLLKNVYNVSVIGSVGSQEKVDFLLKNLGFDAAFNYKKASTAEQLKAFAPDGVDIYYDNVGGEMLDVALLHMATHGRIVICGAISQYDVPAEERYGVKNIIMVLNKRLKMQGAIVFDIWNEFWGQFKKEMLQYILDGKVKVKEHTVQGLENAGQAFIDMMGGQNLGKMVVQCTDDPTRSKYSHFDRAFA